MKLNIELPAVKADYRGYPTREESIVTISVHDGTKDKVLINIGDLTYIVEADDLVRALISLDIYDKKKVPLNIFDKFFESIGKRG